MAILVCNTRANRQVSYVQYELFNAEHVSLGTSPALLQGTERTFVGLSDSQRGYAYAVPCSPPSARFSHPTV